MSVAPNAYTWARVGSRGLAVCSSSVKWQDMVGLWDRQSDAVGPLVTAQQSHCGQSTFPLWVFVLYLCTHGQRKNSSVGICETEWFKAEALPHLAKSPDKSNWYVTWTPWKLKILGLKNLSNVWIIETCSKNIKTINAYDCGLLQSILQ